MRLRPDLAAAVLLALGLASAAGAQLTPLVAVHEGQLEAGGGAADDGLGESLALWGDTAVLGAPGNDHGGFQDAGSVTVFVREAGRWSEQATLTAPSPADGDAFGASAALSGDTLVVGAPMAGGGAGAAHVFVRAGTAWRLQQSLALSGARPGDAFGASVAVDGETLAVAAPGDDHAGAGSLRGAVLVFVRNGTSWSLQRRLVAADAADGDAFGAGVALHGDTLLAGAPGVDAPGAAQAGAAYAFLRDGASWSQAQKLLPSLPWPEGRCGEAVALWSDDALLGAAGEVGPPPGSAAGAAYIFVRAGSRWSLQARLSSSHPSTGPGFGQDVALQVDLAVVAADGLDERGLALGFSRVGPFWSQVLHFDEPPAEPGDGEGSTHVAIADDLVLVAQPADDATAGVDAGSARAWIVVRGPWDDLGGGCAGAAGVPLLATGGVLEANQQVDFGLAGAAPSAPAWFVFSLDNLGLPFHCCTLGPDPTPPQGGYLVRTTTPAGTDALGAVWPAGIPAGLTLDFQYVVADDTLGCAVALSNVLRGTTY